MAVLALGSWYGRRKWSVGLEDSNPFVSAASPPAN
jgi:hypothetical protein